MRNVILGIDPGFRSTGLGVIRTNPLRCADYKVVNSKKMDEQEVASHIYLKLKLCVEKWEPTFMVYEKTSKNHTNVIVQTVIYLISDFYEIPLFGYAPNTIKKQVTGNHLADKKLVAEFVNKKLEMNDGKIPDHCSDALATALTLYDKELTNL